MNNNIHKVLAFSLIASSMLVSSLSADEATNTPANEVSEVVVVEVTPIQKAKKSYYQAITDYAHGEYAKSKKDLQAGMLWLDKAMHSSNKKLSAQAKALKEKTVALENGLSKDTSNASAKLSALLADIKAYSEKSADSVFSDYNSTKVKMHTKAELLDAKLHLAYAHTKQFLLDDKKGAEDELEKTKDALKEAYKSADPKTKKSIQDFENSIDALKKETDKADDTLKVKYQDVKTKMDNTIHNL